MTTSRALRQRVYHSARYVVFRCDLAGPPAADQIDGVAFRVATPSDLEDGLREFDAYGRGSTQRARVAVNGDWLFVACVGQRIVATRRYSRVVTDGLMSRVIDLTKDQVWAADVFCLPEFRNRHVGRRLGLFGDRVLASLGYRELVSAANARNVASIRMHIQIGRRPVSYVAYTRLLFYERLRVSQEVPGALVATVLPSVTRSGVVAAGSTGARPSG